MIITSYEDWREEQIRILADLPDVLCPECDGEGTIECLSCGGNDDCERCDGTGEISKIEEFKSESTRSEYLQSVVREVKEFCSWTGRDFLGEIGPFVRDFRRLAKR